MSLLFGNLTADDIADELRALGPRPDIDSVANLCQRIECVADPQKCVRLLKIVRGTLRSPVYRDVIEPFYERAKLSRLPREGMPEGVTLDVAGRIEASVSNIKALIRAEGWTIELIARDIVLGSEREMCVICAHSLASPENVRRVLTAEATRAIGRHLHGRWGVEFADSDVRRAVLALARENAL